MKFWRGMIPSLPFYLLLWIELFTIEKNEDSQDEEDLEDNENFIKIAVIEDENKAYWVINNIMYEANLVNGEINKEDAKPVDAFNMNYKEVNKLLQILDNIQDWKN